MSFVPSSPCIAHLINAILKQCPTWLSMLRLSKSSESLALPGPRAQPPLLLLLLLTIPNARVKQCAPSILSSRMFACPSVQPIVLFCSPLRSLCFGRCAQVEERHISHAVDFSRRVCWGKPKPSLRLHSGVPSLH